MPTLIVFFPMITCLFDNTDLRSIDEPKVHGEIIDLSKLNELLYTMLVK